MAGEPTRAFSAGDVTGAFADAGVLFPLVAALSVGSGFSGASLLATAGLAYLAAGLWFRVPMAVQPLKAIAIAAIATGAHRGEVRWAGALLGAVCLALAFADTDRWAARVPRPWIHGLQLALGVILVEHGMRAAAGPGAALIPGGWALGAAAVLVWLSQRSSFPWLGVIATGGLAYATVTSRRLGIAAAVPGSAAGPLRPEVIAGLFLPQVVLTLSNSVVGTIDASQRYFGARAFRVTARRLLVSIGAGNLVCASLGGLPFCHGSGGLTAHYKGGARSASANAVIGVTLLAFALCLTGRVIVFPAVLLGTLLAATGLFHLRLAAPSWQSGHERVRLVAMALVALLTQNLLAVLGVGVLPEVAHWVGRARATEEAV